MKMILLLLAMVVAFAFAFIKATDDVKNAVVQQELEQYAAYPNMLNVVEVVAPRS